MLALGLVLILMAPAFPLDVVPRAGASHVPLHRPDATLGEGVHYGTEVFMETAHGQYVILHGNGNFAPTGTRESAHAVLQATGGEGQIFYGQKVTWKFRDGAAKWTYTILNAADPTTTGGPVRHDDAILMKGDDGQLAYTTGSEIAHGSTEATDAKAEHVFRLRHTRTMRNYVVDFAFESALGTYLTLDGGASVSATARAAVMGGPQQLKIWAPAKDQHAVLHYGDTMRIDTPGAETLSIDGQQDFKLENPDFPSDTSPVRVGDRFRLRTPQGFLGTDASGGVGLLAHHQAVAWTLRPWVPGTTADLHEVACAGSDLGETEREPAAPVANYGAYLFQSEFGTILRSEDGLTHAHDGAHVSTKIFSRDGGHTLRYCEPVWLERSHRIGERPWLVVNPDDPHDRSKIDATRPVAFVDAADRSSWLVLNVHGTPFAGRATDGASTWRFGDVGPTLFRENDYAFSLESERGAFLRVEDGRLLADTFSAHAFQRDLDAGGPTLATKRPFTLQSGDWNQNVRFLLASDAGATTAARPGTSVLVQREDNHEFLRLEAGKAETSWTRDRNEAGVWTLRPAGAQNYASDFLYSEVADGNDWKAASTPFTLATEEGAFLGFFGHQHRGRTHVSGAFHLAPDRTFEIEGGIAAYGRPLAMSRAGNPVTADNTFKGDSWTFVNADDPGRRGPVRFGDEVLLLNYHSGGGTAGYVKWINNIFDAGPTADAAEAVRLRVQRPDEPAVATASVLFMFTEFALESLKDGRFLTIENDGVPVVNALRAQTRETFIVRFAEFHEQEGVLHFDDGSADRMYQFYLEFDGTRVLENAGKLTMVPKGSNPGGVPVKRLDTFYIRSEGGQYLAPGGEFGPQWVAEPTDETVWRLRKPGEVATTAISATEEVAFLSHDLLVWVADGVKAHQKFMPADVRLVAEEPPKPEGYFTFEHVRAELTDFVHFGDVVHILDHNGRYVHADRSREDEGNGRFAWQIADPQQPGYTGPVKPGDAILLRDTRGTHTLAAMNGELAMVETGSKDEADFGAFALHLANDDVAIIPPLPAHVKFLQDEEECTEDYGCEFFSALVEDLAWHPLKNRPDPTDPTNTRSRFSDGHELVMVGPGDDMTYVDSELREDGKTRNLHRRTVEHSKPPGTPGPATATVRLVDGRDSIVNVQADEDGLVVRAWMNELSGQRWVEQRIPAAAAGLDSPVRGSWVGEAHAFLRPGASGEEVVVVAGGATGSTVVALGYESGQFVVRGSINSGDYGQARNRPTLGVAPDVRGASLDDHVYVGRRHQEAGASHHNGVSLSLTVYRPTPGSGFQEVHTYYNAHFDPAVERPGPHQDAAALHTVAPPVVRSYARDAGRSPVVLVQTVAWVGDDQTFPTFLVIEPDGKGGSRVSGLLPTACSYGPWYTPTFILTNAVGVAVGDLNGDFVDEIVCWARDSGSENRCAWQYPLLVLDGSGKEVTRYNWCALTTVGSFQTLSDLLVADITQDGSKEIALMYERGRSGGGAWVNVELLQLTDGKLQPTPAVTARKQGDQSSWSLAAADVDDDAIIVSYIRGKEGHTRIMGNPQPMRLFAAPPYVRGIGMAAGTVEFEETRELCNRVGELTVGSMSKHLVAGGGLGGWETTVKAGLQTSFETDDFRESCISSSRGWETVDEGKDMLMFTQTPHDLYTYRVESGSGPREEAPLTVVMLPGKPRVEVWSVDDYRRAVDVYRAMERDDPLVELKYINIPHDVFDHVPGNPATYKRGAAADHIVADKKVLETSVWKLRAKNPIARQDYIEPQKEKLHYKSPVNHATRGAATSVSIAESYSEGVNFWWATEASFSWEATKTVGIPGVADGKAGYEVAFTIGGGRNWETATTEEYSYRATVPNLPPGCDDGDIDRAPQCAGIPQTFDWGMVVYPRLLTVEDADGKQESRMISVVDFFVDNYRGPPPRPVEDAPTPATPLAEETGGRVDFAWRAAAHAHHYQVEVRSSDESTLKLFERSAYVRGTETRPADTKTTMDVPTNTVLAWRVRGFNIAGIPGPWSEWARFAPVAPPPEVAGLRYEDAHFGGDMPLVVVEWDAYDGYGTDRIGGASKYHLRIEGATRGSGEIHHELVVFTNRAELSLPQGEYSVIVAAENTAGLGGWSRPVELDSPAVPPPVTPRPSARTETFPSEGAARACDAARAGGACHALPIRWDPVPHATSYEYRVLDSEGESIQPRETVVATRTLDELEFLPNDEGQVTVQVRAVGVYGASPWRNVTFDYRYPPIAVPNVTDDVSVLGGGVSWAWPNATALPFPQWYDVQASHSSLFLGAPFNYTVVGKADALHAASFVPHDLVHGQYFVRVRGATTGGAGPWSEPVRLQVNEADIDAPRLKARDVASPVTWEALDGGAHDVRYEVLVYAREANPENWVARYFVEETRFFPVEQPEGTYSVRVRAVTTAGTGDWSQPHEIQRPASPADVTALAGEATERKLTVRVDGENKELQVSLVRLPLTWKAPPGDVTEYEVAFWGFGAGATESDHRVIGGSAAREPLLVVNVSDPTVTVNDFQLAAGEYYVRVRAMNGGAPGQWTEPVAVMMESETNRTPGPGVGAVLAAVGAAIAASRRRRE